MKIEMHIILEYKSNSKAFTLIQNTIVKKTFSELETQKIKQGKCKWITQNFCLCGNPFSIFHNL